jgi:glucose/arabinose dehydrogenase
MDAARWLGPVVVIALTACAAGPSAPVQTAAVETVSAAMTSLGPSPTTEPTASEAPTAAPTPAARVASFPEASSAAWSLVIEGFNRPLDLQATPDGRLFVVEQAGRIWEVNDGQRLDPPFFDIRSQVGSNGNEQGLLGLALDPRFAETGRFFVNYTDLGGDTVVSGFRTSPDSGRADPASEFVLLRIEQPYANHNGGGLAFGPDGYLYIGTGDGGSGGDPLGNGQSLNTLLGKLLRLDVEGAEPYAVPSDNPIAASEESFSEIWAYGLRNPWRFTFDPATGDLYIGDVGQGSWEEINFQAAGSAGGENYGWSIREGLHPYSGDPVAGMVDPIAEYGHDQGCSVTGGVVVRDPALPAWNGVYLYGDYCSGRVWGLLPGATAGWQTQRLFDTDFNVTAFGQDASGAAYLLDQRGGVYRLTASN